MPYKSKAQAAFFHAAAARGEMSKKVVAEFDRASKGRMGKLPEHVKKAAAHHVTVHRRGHSDE